MSRRERDMSLDAVKGFTILIVMLGHVLVLNKINDPVLYDWIKAVQMPLFMMVSGYLCGKSRPIMNVREYGRMLGRRVISYMLPFFAWTFVFHLDDFTWAFPAYLEQPERGLWFLVTLFVLTVIACTAQLAEAAVSGRYPAAGNDETTEGTGASRGGSAAFCRGLGIAAFWGVWLIAAAAVFVQERAEIPWLGPHLTKIYLPFYLAAYVYAKQEKRICARVSGRMRGFLALAGGVFCLAVVCTRDMMVMNGLLDYVQQNLASLGGCCAVIAFFYRLGDCRGKRFLSWLGNYTLEIYAIHYHFATLLAGSGVTFAVYSPAWFGFVLAAFAVMSLLTGLVVLAGKSLPVTNFLLYGKRGDSLLEYWRRRKSS